MKPDVRAEIDTAEFTQSDPQDRGAKPHSKESDLI